MTESSKRVGLIGVGRAAEDRVPALRAGGLQVAAVSSRPESRRVGEFAQRHDIDRTYPDWRAMLAQRQWDALVISTWPDGTPEVLEAALSLGVPILVEKPVAWNSQRLGRLCSLAHERVIVGYNRRFYRPVQRARQFVQDGSPVLAQLVLPTNVPSSGERDGTGRYLQQFYESVSALGLDLTRFVLGDLQLKHVGRVMTSTGNQSALAATLVTARGDLLQITANWGAPSNYSLTLDRQGERLELRPFEVAGIHRGMEVEPPTPEYPIRRYVPKLVQRVVLNGDDLRYKPGFVAEGRELLRMIEGEPAGPFAARLEDALAVTRLCEEMTGVVLDGVYPSPYDD